MENRLTAQWRKEIYALIDLAYRVGVFTKYSCPLDSVSVYCRALNERQCSYLKPQSKVTYTRCSQSSIKMYMTKYSIVKCTAYYILLYAYAENSCASLLYSLHLAIIHWFVGKMSVRNSNKTIYAKVHRQDIMARCTNGTAYWTVRTEERVSTWQHAVSYIT